MYDVNYQEVSSSVREKQALSEISMNEFAFKEQLKLNSYIQRTEAKQWITAQENELQRSHFHSIALNSDGSIIEIENSSVPNSTKNLICNMQNPRLTELRHYGNDSDKIYQLDATVNNHPVSVFLDSERLGNGSYLCRKFVASGITFFSDSTAHRKQYATDLICLLVGKCEHTALIYDNSGWYLTPEKKFIFSKKEATSWKILLKKTR